MTQDKIAVHLAEIDTKLQILVKEFDGMPTRLVRVEMLAHLHDKIIWVACGFAMTSIIVPVIQALFNNILQKG